MLTPQFASTGANVPLNQSDIKGAYKAIIGDTGRGEVLRAATSSLTPDQLTQLFDTIISGDAHELGELVTSWLQPVIEKHVCEGLKKKFIFDNRGDNEI